MAINEVFSNPTVKQVSFEVRFPNLFYIEKSVGEFQMKILAKFPRSKEILRRQFFLADLGPEARLQPLPEDLDSNVISKIWYFESDKGLFINLKTNSLSVHSSQHKTYDNPGSDERFKDLIEFVVSNFLAVIPIPIFDRIGLRYIDECPIFEKTNEDFLIYYNTTFPLDRYDIADASEMQFFTLIKRGDNYIKFVERLMEAEGKSALIMDYDAFSNNVSSDDYLATTDILHKLISEEYDLSIKNPLKEYMRRPKEPQND